MSFFDKKQDVIDIKLTQFGKTLEAGCHFIGGEVKPSIEGAARLVLSPLLG